jgi:hypothetical protein
MQKTRLLKNTERSIPWQLLMEEIISQSRPLYTALDALLTTKFRPVTDTRQTTRPRMHGSAKSNHVKCHLYPLSDSSRQTITATTRVNNNGNNKNINNIDTPDTAQRCIADARTPSNDGIQYCNTQCRPSVVMCVCVCVDAQGNRSTSTFMFPSHVASLTHSPRVAGVVRIYMHIIFPATKRERDSRVEWKA